MGDQVSVNPRNAKCTSTWGTDNVTALVSNTTVIADSMTRHVGDIRFCWRPNDSLSSTLINYELDIDSDSHIEMVDEATNNNSITNNENTDRDFLMTNQKLIIHHVLLESVSLLLD